jgi:3-hydroxybutyryl-CoA dehydrogenase
VLAEGSTSATEIDEGMTLGCNHPIGPLALSDLIGLVVLLATMQTFHDEFGDPKYRPCRCSRSWLPQVTLVAKPGVVSTGTHSALRISLHHS